jgi:peptidyl-prolyl cis-trans isomerase-like 3
MAVTFHTSLGPVKIELFCEECPVACENFLALCASGFYDSLVFHRVIPNFLIQSGDNTRTGTGGNSALGDDVRSPPTDVFNDAWIVAYADQDPIRSQFFITVRPQPQLNGEYCGFGRVIFGANVVQAISRTPTFEDNFPVSPAMIKSATIHFNPFAT